MMRPCIICTFVTLKCYTLTADETIQHSTEQRCERIFVHVLRSNVCQCWCFLCRICDAANFTLDAQLERVSKPRFSIQPLIWNEALIRLALYPKRFCFARIYRVSVDWYKVKLEKNPKFKVKSAYRVGVYVLSIATVRRVATSKRNDNFIHSISIAYSWLCRIKTNHSENISHHQFH